MDPAEEDRILKMMDSLEKEERERIDDFRVAQDSVRKQLFDVEDEDRREDELIEYEDKDDEGEMDNLHHSDHDTDTEESAGEEDDNALAAISQNLPLPTYIIQNRATSPACPMYTGKDGTTTWRIHSSRQRGRTRRRNIVTHLPGPKGEARNVSTPIEAWKLFFPDNEIGKIVKFTNVWIEENKANYSRERDALPTDVKEMKAVFGLLYLAGVLRSSHQNLEDLWATDGTGVDLFRTTMSLRRFKLILRAMRFDNIHNREETIKVDRLAKIREIFEPFVERCALAYTPSEYCTIDEMLEGFRGKCIFRQYIPSKPNKYGIKVFALTCAKTFYTVKMEIYAGKQPEGLFINNSPAAVVERMVQPISGSGRNVTMDNWFMSVPLVVNLLENHRLTAVGTIKKNKREIPPIFITKNKPINFSMFAFRDDCTLLSYAPKKNKIVLLISSLHETDSIDETSGEAKKPEQLTFYNMTKGGVDTVDELKATYSVSRTSCRWPMTIFYGLLNIAGINAMVVLRDTTNQKLIRRKFLKELSWQLCLEYLQYRETISCLSRDIKMRIRSVLQERSGEKEQDSQSSSIKQSKGPGRCAYCDWRKHRKTKTQCNKCQSFICREHTVTTCVGCSGTAGIDEDD